MRFVFDNYDKTLKKHSSANDFDHTCETETSLLISSG